MTRSTLICKLYLNIVSRVQLIKYWYIFYFDRQLCEMTGSSLNFSNFQILPSANTTRIDVPCFQNNTNKVYIFFLKIKNSNCANLLFTVLKEEKKRINTPIDYRDPVKSCAELKFCSSLWNTFRRSCKPFFYFWTFCFSVHCLVLNEREILLNGGNEILLVLFACVIWPME